MDFVTLSIVLCFHCFSTEYNTTLDEFKNDYLVYLGKCKEVIPKINSQLSLDEQGRPPTAAQASKNESLRLCFEHNFMSNSHENAFMKKNLLRMFGQNTSSLTPARPGGSASREGVKKPASKSSAESSKTSAEKRPPAVDPGSSKKGGSSDTSDTVSINNNFTLGENGLPAKQSYNFLVTVFLVALYTITIVVSFIGNVLVIIVMCCGFRSSYLDISTYLSNLGIFNLLMATFCLPFTFVNVLVGRWIFSSFMCPLTNFFQMLSVNGCTLTLTTLAINRFLAVTMPLKFNTETNKNYIIKSLVFIWVVSLALSSIQLFIYKCVCFDDPGATEAAAPAQHAANEYEGHSVLNLITKLNSLQQSAEPPPTPAPKQICYCKEVWDSNDQSNSSKFYLGYTIWIFFQTYFIPVIILIITSSKIIDILRKRNRDHEYYQTTSNTSSSENFRNKTIKSIRMLIVVMGTFALNWLPIHIFQLWISFASYYNLALNNKVWITVVFFACHWLSMSNSFINPIIYSFMNQTFKSDLRHLIHCNKLAKRTQSIKLNPDNQIMMRNTRRIPNQTFETLIKSSDRKNQKIVAHVTLLKKMHEARQDPEET